MNKPLIKFTMVCLTIPETLWFTNIFPSGRVLKWSRQIHIATSKKIEKTYHYNSVGFYFFPFFPSFRSGDCCIAWKKYASFGWANSTWRFSCLVSPPVFHHGLPILKMVTPSIFIIWGLSSLINPLDILIDIVIYDFSIHIYPWFIHCSMDFSLSPCRRTWQRRTCPPTTVGFTSWRPSMARHPSVASHFCIPSGLVAIGGKKWTKNLCRFWMVIGWWFLNYGG